RLAGRRFPGRRRGAGVLRVRLALRAAAFLDLEEGVLDELLLDPVEQVQPGELEDLHRLDHLRRLDESLLQAGGLGETELQRRILLRETMLAPSIVRPRSPTSRRSGGIRSGSDAADGDRVRGSLARTRGERTLGLSRREPPAVRPQAPREDLDLADLRVLPRR